MHADDMDLVREFATSGSETAFAALVHRHVNLVYSAALRRLGNAVEAEEVAQIVFTILARKAGSLRRGTILSGWLYQTAQLTAANHQRAAIRRQHREQEAFMQFTEQSEPDASWHRLSPLLEEAMTRLGQKDRDAIVLRFFENRTVREVAAALGLREDAAQKRVNRATDRLRKYFARRGIQVSAAALLTAIGANAVKAAPVQLASKIAGGAALKGALGGGSALTLKTTLKIMAWTKAKTAIVSGVVVLLAAGTTTITVQQISHHREAVVWDHISAADSRQLDGAPAVVSIRPTKFHPSASGSVFSPGKPTKFLGLDQPVAVMISTAYDMNKFSKYRVVLNTKLPEGNYDYIANLREGNETALQRELGRQFHLTGRTETRETDVLLLTKKHGNAPGLKPSTATPSQDFNITGRAGYYKGGNAPISKFAMFLEYYFESPVIDRTGLAGRFEIDLEWQEQDWQHHNPEGLKQALLDQLGLELVPSHEPVEMLVVERAK